MIGCPYCFGDANSDQVHAAKIGVLVLLAFIVPLLGAIAFTARTWAKRARKLASDQPRRSEEAKFVAFEKQQPFAS